MQPPAPSKSSVKKAGTRIRAWGRGELTDRDTYEAALDVLEAYRSQFAVPMNSLAMGLRSMAKTLQIDAEVSQRLKRTPTILEKLQRREDAPDLSRMGDIGGCRAVVPTRTDLWALVARARTTWSSEIVKELDYIATPRTSGYRAVHLLVKRAGRLIEVQFRDAALHEWAQGVEAMSMLTRTNYKQDGSSAVQDFMAVRSMIEQCHEHGEEVDSELLRRAATLREQVIEELSSPTRDHVEGDR